MTVSVDRPAPSARNLAFAVLRDVFGPAQRGAAESLDHHLQKSALDARDRGFATELAYGTIERRRWLDWQLAPYLGDRATKLPLMIAEILRMGTFQLRAMRVHDYAAVSESVQLARRFGHPGTAGLVNAVLRRVAADPERPVLETDVPSEDDVVATRASLPTWLVRTWRERFGEDKLDAIIAGVNGRSAIGLAVDARKATLDDVIARLQAAGIVASPSPFAGNTLVLEGTTPTPAIEAAVGDTAELHAESACFPVDLLDPRRDTRVLELCSGRGNKTLQIVGATRDAATVVSIDSDERKVERARTRLESHGVTSVAMATADATTYRGDELFASVLVDAPCSGLGIIGRQPEARWRKTPDDGARLAPLQAAILANAGLNVAPGGRLVYAVCSTDMREGEGIVVPFLAENTDFVRDPIPERYAPFATAAGDVLVPPGIDGRDGFFIAVLRRR